MVAEEKWDHKAQQEDLRCGLCGLHIEYDDREIYYQTGNCGYCEHLMTRDD
jgi:hypothetical protein